MTIVKGEIESLKRLRNELYKNNINRFKSTKEINDFSNSYKIEKEAIFKQAEESLDRELDVLVRQEPTLELNYINRKNEIENKFNSELQELHYRINSIKSQTEVSFIRSIINVIVLFFINLKLSQKKNKFETLVKSETRSSFYRMEKAKTTISNITNNREQFINDRARPQLSELNRIKRTVDNLYPLISGAVGENLVVKELKKVPSNNILINDYSLSFDYPIYNRLENERIYSVQIDHVLVTRAGIFLIETKNWSKNSVNNISLRSPIAQIKRTSYAMYTLLNGKQSKLSSRLDNHHWGEKKVPITNLIVMINNKPNGQFKFVEIKLLKELNRFIATRRDILSQNEVVQTAKYLEYLSY